MPSGLRISFKNKSIIGSPALPASKSESNRALILNAFSGNKLSISGLSEARDTRILNALLGSDAETLDAQDAGTTFRFLASFLAFSNRSVVLTGSERMQKRPIGILVEALQKLGCKIKYLKNDGFPPLQFEEYTVNAISEIDLDATVSSQYISAIMMAAPSLPNGLKINLSGDSITSLPYLKMTWKMMQHMLIQGEFTARQIMIPNQKYKPNSFTVEGDWSAASYWFAMAAVCELAEIHLENLFKDSLQGDSAIVEMIALWGVHVEYTHTGIILTKSKGENANPSVFIFDFSNVPDLAQTMVVLCAITGVESRFTGLKSLAIKETNRLVSLQTELRKVGIQMEIDDYEGTCFIPGKQELKNPTEPFNTYEDHRMAMCISILALKFPIEVRDPEVIEKSYPQFWTALESVGFDIEPT